MALARLLAVLVLLAAGAGTVLADTIELRNGRRIEGKVLARSTTSVRILVECGTMELPRDQVASIVVEPLPEDELAERLQATSLDDPDAVEALARWAQARGLGERAAQLRELARGVRLERTFARARELAAAGDASGWLRAEVWARRAGFSLEVRRLALASARAASPRLEGLEAAEAELDGDRRAQDAAVAAAVSATAARRQGSELAARERAVAEREREVAEREERLLDRAPQTEVGGEPPPPTGPAVWVVRRGRSVRSPDPEDDRCSRPRVPAPPAPKPAQPEPMRFAPLPPAPTLPPQVPWMPR